MANEAAGTPVHLRKILPPDEARKAAAAAEAKAATFGRIVALLMISPRHSKITLSDLNLLVAPPVALGQFAIVGAKHQEDGPVSIAAAVWWAFVSPEVDKQLTASREDILRLEAGDWKSGDQPWIIEAIGETRVVNELVAQVARRNFKGKPAKLRAVSPEGKLGVALLGPKTHKKEV